MFNAQRLLLNLSIPTLICAQCSPVQTSSVLPSPQSIPWFSDEFEEWYSVTQPWNTEHEGADLGRQGLPKQTFQHFSLFLTSPLPLLWEVPVTVNCLDLGTLQYNSVCFLASLLQDFVFSILLKPFPFIYSLQLPNVVDISCLLLSLLQICLFMGVYSLLLLLTVISVGLAEGEEVNVSCECMEFILPYLP